MKAKSPKLPLALLLMLATCLLLATASGQQADIVKIVNEGEVALVHCNVAPGHKFVRVETKDDLTDEDAPWIPRDGVEVDGRGGTFIIRIQTRLLANCVRLAAIPMDTEDLSQGETNFDGEVTNVSAGPPPPTPTTPTDAVASPEESDTTTARTLEVVDADIWAFNDDRLYIYNRLKGLQIVDVANPDESALLDTLPMANQGEKMFLLDDEHVLLIASDGCVYSSYEATARGIIVSTAGDVAAPISEFPIQGSVREARLVGNALYVVTYAYSRALSENGRYAYNAITSLQSFDLADRAEPVAAASHDIEGHTRFIYANPTMAVLGTFVDWYSTQLDLIDISSPTGEFDVMSRTTINGYMEDEFKVRISGDRMITIDERRDRDRWWENRESVVTSWSIMNPAEPIILSEVGMGLGERLFATHIEDDFAYVVTFRQIDPLWIVDLRDRTELLVSGELEVPGFSTFIEPYGDQLITVGREENLVAVSLFDVGDIFNPTLNSRVLLGEGYSSTEANYEEKAFTVLKDENLIMLPFRDQNGAGLQLIDLFPSGITARGVVYEDTAPRRAASHNDRLISVTGRQLVTLDASDRDLPIATQRLTLAEPTDRIFKSGNYRVEIDGAVNYWYGSSGITTVRVRDMSSGEVVNEFTTECPLVDASLNGNTLACLSVSSTYPNTNLDLKLYDLGDLPEVNAITNITGTASNLSHSGFNAHWMQNERLIWETEDYGYYYIDGPIPVDAAARSAGSGRSDYLLPYSGNKTFLVFDLAAGTFEGVRSWQAPRGTYSGTIIEGDGTLFVSYSQSEYRTGTNNVPEDAQSQVDDFLIEHPPEEIQIYIQYQKADRLDFDGPELVATTLDLPFPLRAITPNNRFITAGSERLNGQYTGNGILAVLDYDGSSLMLLDSINLGRNSYPPIITIDETILVLNRGDEHGMLVSYILDENDRLQAADFANLTGRAYRMHKANNLLVVYTSDIDFFDISNPLEFTPIEMVRPTLNCYTPNFLRGDGDVTEYCAPAGEFGIVTYRQAQGE